MIEVDIVTPTKKLAEGIQATSVKLPAWKGQIEVMPGHTELLTLLNTGPLVIQTDGRTRTFAVSYGFAEIRNDRIIVCAETAEESTDINRERARAAQKKAEEVLGGVLTEENFRKYQLKLERSLIRQQIAQ